jgi:hypothetical protein
MEQQAPMGAAPQPQQPQQQQAGGGIPELVTNIRAGMGQLQQIVAQTAPGGADRMQSLIEQYESLINDLASGGSQQSNRGPVPIEGAGRTTQPML